MEFFSVAWICHQTMVKTYGSRGWTYRTRKPGGFTRTVYRNPFRPGTTYKAVPPIRKRPGAPLRTGRRVRTRLNTGRSYTLTKTKKRINYGQAHKTGDNSSVSALRYGRYMTRFMMQQFRTMRGKQTVYRNGTVTKTSAGGQQAFLQQDFLNTDELDLIRTKYGSATLTANEVKFFLGYNKIKYYIKNQSNAAGRLTIYDIVPKQHPRTTFLDTPVEAWEKGIKEMTTGQPSNLHLTVGNTPFMSPEFKRFYHVLRATNIQMEPGQQHVHNVYKRINRIVASTEWDHSSIKVCPGVTSWVMLVWNGSLGHESAAVDKVSFMPMKLDVAWSQQFNYAVCDNNAPSYDLTDTFAKDVVDWDHMGENQDQDMDNLAA